MKTDQKIIASLTTHGERIQTVHLALKTILCQSKKPDKVVLWLSSKEFENKELPKELIDLTNEGVEIAFCDDIRSYKKLIPALQAFPNDLIITFDDDILYENDIIEKLMDAYEKMPDVIHCVRGHRIRFSKEGDVRSYNEWEMCSEVFTEGYDIFPTCGAGALFFAGCFDDEVFNKEVYLSLAPHADDVWFKAMSLKSGVKCKILPQENKRFMMLNTIEGTQEEGLWMQNQDEASGNNPQIKAVFERYGLHGKESIMNRFDSANYWEERYKNGGNSGAGSYNALAEFKAQVLNSFVKKEGVKELVEFGSGDGNNASLYEIASYTGVDVSKEAVKRCKERFKADTSKQFFHISEFTPKKYETAISFDVIFHLIEDEVFHEYMQRLFENAGRFVIVYASNRDEEHEASHVKHRKFTDWIEQNQKEWKLKEFIKNRYPFDEKHPDSTSYSDFYIFEKEDS